MGLLFARRSQDIGSAVGWGVSYGFFWWILGPLTLAPILLGVAPRWTAPAAAALLPSLVGHLAYGAGGVTFHLLEPADALSQSGGDMSPLSCRAMPLIGFPPIHCGRLRVYMEKTPAQVSHELVPMLVRVCDGNDAAV